MELVIASRNIHKIREFRAMLKHCKWLDILSLLDFPSYTPLEEEGESFEEIASKKATHTARTLSRFALADDSGLVVPALGGAPGIYSARFAGQHATDAENRHKLLSEMRHIQEPDRQAYFECCLALASPEGLKKCVRGTCEGLITTQEKGSHGFGYDPLFIKYEYGKTFAELEEDTKNRISHRRKALDKILISLEQLDKVTH